MQRINLVGRRTIVAAVLMIAAVAICWAGMQLGVHMGLRCDRLPHNLKIICNYRF